MAQCKGMIYGRSAQLVSQIMPEYFWKGSGSLSRGLGAVPPVGSGDKSPVEGSGDKADDDLLI